jgi:hypothetical protein
MSDYCRLDQLDDSDVWDEEADDADPLPEAFAEFLLHDAKGPKIDQETVDLLARYGAFNQECFVLFTKYSVDELLAALTNRELREMNRVGLQKLTLYGKYIVDHSLITKDGLIDLTAFISTDYTLYWKTRRRRFGIEFCEAMDGEVEKRIHEQEARRIRRNEARSLTDRGLRVSPRSLLPDQNKARLTMREMIFRPPRPTIKVLLSTVKALLFRIPLSSLVLFFPHSLLGGGDHVAVAVTGKEPSTSSQNQSSRKEANTERAKTFMKQMVCLDEDIIETIPIVGLTSARVSVPSNSTNQTIDPLSVRSSCRRGGED